jgi:hypothetical protein
MYVQWVTAETVPTGHVRHWVSLLVALLVGPYFPDGHWVQGADVDAPVVTE